MSQGFELAEPPRNERLYTLLRRVRTGDILIPRFQRGFVWTDEKRLTLLDSIYRRMPVGTVILWRTVGNELTCFDRIAGVPVQAGAAKRPGWVKSYLLDGLQRLTTLYAAFGEGLEARDAELSGPSVVEDLEELPGDDRPSALVFDLVEQEFRVAPLGRPLSPTWFPLARLFDRHALREFEDENLRDLSDGRALLARLDALVEAVKDYEIPVVTLATEDESVATEAFTRINSQGTPIDHVNLVGAAVWSDGLDLKRLIDDEIRPALAEVGWQELDDKMILNTAKALLNLDIYRTDAAGIGEALSETRDAIFAQTAHALVSAARLLARDGIYGPAVLPYSYQIVLLANALSRVGSAAHTSGLIHWFWATTYAETFAGMNSSRLMHTMRHVVDVAWGQADPLNRDLLGLEGPVRSTTRFDFRSARSRAIAVLLAEHAAVLEDGGESRPARRVPSSFGSAAVPMLFTGTDVPEELRRHPGNRFVARPYDVRKLRKRLTQGADKLTSLMRVQHLMPTERQTPSKTIRYRAMLLAELEEQRVVDLGLEYEAIPLSK